MQLLPDLTKPGLQKHTKSWPWLEQVLFSVLESHRAKQGRHVMLEPIALNNVGHTGHVEPSAAGEYVPEGHWAQVASRGRVGHAVHTEAPVPENVPPGHAVHSYP